MRKEVKIGNRTIGDGYDCFVIAEIGINHNGYFIAYSWGGGATYRMDYDDLVGAYVDSNHNIKLVFNPEHSDDNIDDNTLSALEYNREFVIEHIVQQIYILKRWENRRVE